jgi:hypothetical protein
MRKKNLEFEILESDYDSVTFKRVLKKRGNAKEKYKKEIQLPTLTMYCFDEEELERLRKIELEISKTYPKENRFMGTISEFAKNLLTS